jgi:two-component system sensor histidine kinase/response regulator
MSINVNVLWNKLIGGKHHFALEGRIFHSVCIIVMFGLALNIPFNYLIGLPKLAGLMLAVLLVVAVAYYVSRFYKMLRLAIVTFQVINNLMLVANYYDNSGLNGPTLAIFLLSFIIAVSSIPQKQYVVWLPINVLTMLSLMYWEATHPGWIKNTYPDKSSRFADFGYSYIIIAALIFFIIAFIRSAYHEERRRAEHEAAELAASNETKNKLLSILAHDLKEPLASVQGFLELLTYYKLDDTERRNIQHELLNRTRDTAQMLGNVLSWTKSQMEGVQVQLMPLQLLDTLNGTLQLLKSISAEKQIDLQYDIDENTWVTADPDMLQLVIRNVVMNAIKFTLQGGKVAISTTTGEGKCTIAIADNGLGIPAEKQAKLFSISEQVTYGTGKEKGAGLGLVLCKNFVELQGGNIWFKTEPGLGSTFFISLNYCLPVTDGSSADTIAKVPGAAS